MLHAKKILLLITIAASAIVIAIPSVTHAGPIDWVFGKIGNIAYTVFTDAAFIISYIVGLVLGAFIAVEAWGIALVLQLSMKLVDSPPVQFGVPVTTYIANLGFVVAIVVMAIMTILRRESYGMKQTIAKLILAAILVNFSLIIAGTILNFSDQLSIAFLNQVDPGSEEGSFNSLATSIAGAFNPQAFLVGDDKGFEDLLEENPGEGLFGSIGAIFMPLVSVLFSLFALLFITLVLGALVVMLLIRYVYIAGLLIFMPLAWVAWIFPVTKHHFSDWWSKFFKQVFFAPIVIFTVWLTIKTGEAMGSAGYKAATYASDNYFGDAIGDFLAPVIRQLLDAIVLCGIMVMGMIAANKMGAVGASAAVDRAKAIGNWSGNYMKNRGIQAGTSFLRKPSGPDGKPRTERLAAWAANQRNPFKRFVGGYAAQGVAAIGARGTRLVNEYEKDTGNMTVDQLVAAASVGPAYKRIAAEKELTKRKALDHLPAETTHTEARQKEYERYGEKKAYQDMEKTAGFSMKTYQALKGNDREEAAKEHQEFLKTFTRADLSQKTQIDDLLSGKEGNFGFSGDMAKSMSDVFINGLIERPDLISQSIAKIKTGSADKFKGAFISSINKAMVDAANANDEARGNYLTGVKEQYDQIIANNVLFSASVGASASAPTAGAAPAGH